MIKRLAAALENRDQQKVTLLWLETQLVTLLAALDMQTTRYARRPVFSGFGRFSCEQAYYLVAGVGRGRRRRISSCR